MERERSIEALSLFFTAGVAAGSATAGLHSGLSATLLLSLIALPLLFREKIRLIAPKTATSIILCLFLLLGMLCSFLSSFPAPIESGPLSDVAREAAQRLARFIGAIPFRHDGTAPLLTALLTGAREGLSPEMTAVFRNSGASHLLALSGLHMGILYLILDKCSKPLGKSRAATLLRYGLLLSGAGFFTLMTGASPSIVRAFLFITIGETMRLLHRPRNGAHVLCLALLVQLALNPQAIRSLGFQLSYLALAGIFLLFPLLESWYPGKGSWNPFRLIWQASALSISCQVFTAPLIWYRFHTFPHFFLLTNLLAIPLTTALMGTAVVTLILCALGVEAGILIRLTDTLCQGLVRILDIIASLS